MTNPLFPTPDLFSQGPLPEPTDPLEALAEAMQALEQRLVSWISRFTGDPATGTAVHPNPDPNNDLVDPFQFENH